MSSPWPTAFSMIGASGATGATGAQGDTGGVGVSIYNGLEIPSDTGAQGDYFINNNTRDIYTYSTNTWNNLFNPEAYFSSIRTNAIMFSDSGPSTIQSTITISSVSTYTSTFLYTGTPETFTIPQGTTELTFEVLGGGGANAGGGGAYISGTGEIPENFSGSSVWIYVGQGGQLTGNSLGFRVGVSEFYLTTSGGSAATSTDPTSVGGGGGGASGIVFESNRSRIIAGAGAGGYAYGTDVYQGGAGGLQNGSEPLEPVLPPTAITGLASTNVSSSAFTVSWSGGSGTGVTTSYTLNGSVGIPSSSAAGTATFSGLTASTAYTVVVIATNSDGSVNSSLLVTTSANNSVSPVLLLKAVNYTGTGAWNDESGNGFNATLENGVIAKNTAGNGIVLNGSTGWTFPNPALGNAWSVNVWYKQLGSISPSCCIITQLYNGDINMNISNLNDDGSQMVVGFSNTTLTTGNNSLNNHYFNGTNIASYLTQGTWVNIQGTWDGSSIKTYINGALVGTVSLPGAASRDNGLAYRIGRRWDAAQFMTGEIGEVRIYNSALNAAAVAADYNSSLATFQ